jgi:hypothetical protein
MKHGLAEALVAELGMYADVVEVHSLVPGDVIELHVSDFVAISCVDKHPAIQFGVPVVEFGFRIQLKRKPESRGSPCTYKKREPQLLGLRKAHPALTTLQTPRFHRIQVPAELRFVRRPELCSVFGLDAAGEQLAQVDFGVLVHG